jgi:hypothetical protein
MLCSFLAAAISVTSVHTFMGTGTCLIKDDDQVLCMVRPDQAERLLIPFPRVSARFVDPDSDNSDTEEEQCQSQIIYISSNRESQEIISEDAFGGKVSDSPSFWGMILDVHTAPEAPKPRKSAAQRLLKISRPPSPALKT